MRKHSGNAVAILVVREVADSGEARRLKRILGSLEGVSAVEMNYTTSVVSIRYDAKKLNVDSIRAAINPRKKR